MENVNLVKLIEELEFFDKLEEFKDLEKSDLFGRNEILTDGTARMVVYNPEVGIWYHVNVEDKTPYYLGEKAVPAGMATSFQRSLGWKIAQKIAFEMVSKIENDTITWNELIALSKIDVNDALASLELRRAITKWFSRNGENLIKLSQRISYVYPGSHWQLWPAKYDGSGKVIESYYSDFLYYDNSGKIGKEYYYDCL